MSRGFSTGDFYSSQRMAAERAERARNEQARKRADAQMYLTGTSLMVIFWAGIIVLGFHAMAWGIVPVAFVCWLAGGAGMLFFGLFWIGAVREWWRTR